MRRLSLLRPTGEVTVHTAEPSVQEHSDVHEFIALIRRHALLIAFTTIATAVAAYAFSARQADQYSAGTTLLYAPADSTAQGDPSRALDTIVGVALSNKVLKPVADAHGLSLGDLQSKLSVSSDANADILAIKATTDSKELAAALPNDAATALTDFRLSQQKEKLQAQAGFLQQQLNALAGKTDPSSVAVASSLQTQLAELRAQLHVLSPDLTVVTPATVPSSPSSPHPKRNAAIGALVGLVLGIMLAALRDRLDRSVRSVEEVEAVYHAPMLGMVPFLKRRNREELLADFSTSGALADAYRTIRTNLALFRLNDSESTVVVVSSAIAEEGKSAVAANLAHALSVMGKSVLAVSADLHNPSLHKYFENSPRDGSSMTMSTRLEPMEAGGSTHGPPARGRDGQGGLVQVLAGDLSLDQAVQEVRLTARERASGGSLGLLANDSTFFDPAVLFTSGSMTRFLAEARAGYDVVVLDAPPLLVNADASMLAQRADAVLLVARLNLLTRNQARRAVRIMSAAHIAPTGVIVIGEADDTSYGYGYSSSSASSDEYDGAGGRPAAERSAPANN